MAFPQATSTSMALVLVAVSLFAATLVHMDFAAVQSGVPGTQSPQRQTPSPEDSTYLMQSSKVTVDRLSVIDQQPLMQKPTTHVDRKSLYEKELSNIAKDTDDASLLGGAPIHSKSQRKAPVVALAATQTGTFTARLQGMLHSATHRLTEQMQYEMGVKSFSGPVALLAILVVLVVIALSSLMCIGRRGERASANANGQAPKDIATVMAQRERMLAHTSPSARMCYPPNAPAPSTGGFGSQPFLRSEPFLHSEMSPSSQQFGLPGAGGSHIWGPSASNALAQFGSQPHLMPAPREISAAPSPRLSMTDVQRQSMKPPPLCPTLVMPMSEALLGIKMYELAELSAEGELTIVGISGKPLLRAEVKKIGDARSLEIAMPERNSIPRATIAPPAAGEMAGGSRALEIRGMRGSFYGILEMRSSGACYVVKDGQTVLTIDGDAESLQLSIKSSVGLQLASVRCSTELFDGVDHVEVRVEPGVDTVLVIAVVLAVLLLSPYLPPAD